MSLPKYVSYWYVQDAIKKATRDCMYHGMNSPQCKASWNEVECIDAYFTDRFRPVPKLTRSETEDCIKKIDVFIIKSDADIRQDTHWKDGDARG